MLHFHVMSAQNDNSQNVSNAAALLTFHAPTFEIVLGRLKKALGLQTDAALHGLLGMSSSRYANRKRSGSIPYEQVLALCSSRNVNLNWLFYGEGPTFHDGRMAESPAVVDFQTLGAIYAALIRCYAQKKFAPEKSDAQLFGITLLAQSVQIYNAVVFEGDANSRKRRIESEAETSANSYILFRDAEKILQS